jgi:hypothetical protein
VVLVAVLIKLSPAEFRSASGFQQGKRQVVKELWRKADCGPVEIQFDGECALGTPVSENDAGQEITR